VKWNIVSGEKRLNDPLLVSACCEVLTVLALTDVGKFIGITKSVHEGCKACRVEVDRMIGEKSPNKLLESQVANATVSVSVAIVVALVLTGILIHS
jgi:hypothetical protein